MRLVLDSGPALGGCTLLASLVHGFFSRPFTSPVCEALDADESCSVDRLTRLPHSPNKNTTVHIVHQAQWSVCLPTAATFSAAAAAPPADDADDDDTEAAVPPALSQPIVKVDNARLAFTQSDVGIQLARKSRPR